MPDSLAEFVAQSSRGLYGRIFGPDFLKKQSYLTVSASTFAQTYGRKIWDALNNRTVFYNAIKKVPWGPTAGWVLRTDRGSGRVRPVTETGTIPTVDVSNYQGVYVLPKIVAADFGVPITSIVVNTLEGGMGDILAAEMQACERDFVKGINQELMAGTAAIISNGSTTSYVTNSTWADNSVSVGDTWYWWDVSDGATEESQGGVVSSVSSGTVTVSTLADTPVDGDVMYAHTRAGFTSIDDICMYDAVTVGGAQAHTNVYNITTRTASTYAAGGASYNSGVGRDLSLELIDNGCQTIRTNGGEPKLIVTGWDQYYNLERLLNAQQRYMGQEMYQVGVGDERTLPGTRVGLVLSTYMGIPILPDPDTARSVNTADTQLGSNLFILDTDYLEVAVAMPTQYMENRDFLNFTRLIVRGLMYMMGELRCTRVDVQYKIADLNT